MSFLPKGIFCFEFTVLFTKSSPRSHILNVLYDLSLEIRELFLFTVLLKFIKSLPFLFSANRCAKKVMLRAGLVPISRPTEVPLFVLKQLEKLNSILLMALK